MFGENVAATGKTRIKIDVEKKKGAGGRRLHPQSGDGVHHSGKLVVGVIMVRMVMIVIIPAVIRAPAVCIFVPPAMAVLPAVVP